MKAVLTVLSALTAVTLGTQAKADSIANMKPIIAGKLMRSGSNNNAHSPLSRASLESLCEQGYTLVVYGYKGANGDTVSCGKGSLLYISYTNFRNPEPIANQIASEIATGGKVLVHCWWGVHSSNALTSAALVKSCNFTGDQAADWFRGSVSKASLSPKAIKPETVEDILASLRNMRPDGTRVSGCPKPLNP